MRTASAAALDARDRAPERMPELDGVRAIAVLGVIASHAGLIHLGWVGVDIFFGLSGFLITGILLDAKACAPNARRFFVPFYMRRALRILPLAWTFAILVALFSNQWSGIGWYVGYLVNWLPSSPPPDLLGHYWSLAVEEQFYLVWPAVVFLLSRRALLRATIGIIALDMFLRVTISYLRPDFATPQFLGLATFARADTLAVGALLAQRVRAGPWGWEAKWAPAVGILALAALIGVNWMELQGHRFIPYNLKWPVIAVGVGAGLIYVLTRSPRVLRWPWLVWLGQISYGIYVIHALFGRWLREQLGPTAPLEVFLAEVALTVPLAAFSWYFFEAPILRQKWRWPMPSRKEVDQPAL
jgi:peptidoglycan/LPS O-acetylase OafA/YrhL